ncbi:dihydroflavonol-4-reductase [Devosia pacifica]|uniref:Dihydroflavonol-4-reductase n=1 Tax=Devosia pacifica TaxID=1335967 RepID=A0A918VRQ9_9HYPH|nr:NAD-dependent epimerase/dehydratase family protein [Devosia pacifica]GHA18400.1 dihydroflavonol-4-reductase [Devosia pacifica]
MNDWSIATKDPVLVTGATGYVAGWIVKYLLEAGVTVHAAVRDAHNKDKLRHLDDLAASSPGTIKYFEADLLKPGSYGAAMQGCRIVFHTASPFKITVEDPQRDLVTPALEGTRNVLKQASATETVERVVLTSSCAAIYTDAIECQNAPGGRLTEVIWNTTASLEYQPYSYSKTVAEKAAWDIAEAQHQWRLVAINPSLVLGPAIGGKPTSESFSLIRQMGDGTMRFGAPNAGIGVVDVRDVARAHIAAAFNPDAQGRHILSGHNTSFLEIAQSLQPRFGDRYKLPKRALPKRLLWLLAPLAGFPRAYVERNIDVEWHADNTKSIHALGVNYRPLQQSSEDMFEQMIEAGLLPDR